MNAADAIVAKSQIDDVTKSRQRPDALQIIADEVQCHCSRRQVKNDLRVPGAFTDYCRPRPIHLVRRLSTHAYTYAYTGGPIFKTSFLHLRKNLENMTELTKIITITIIIIISLFTQ